jgi:diguanylate cyclase (GGDEF)-like protein
VSTAARVPSPNSETLLKIIRMQTQIAKLGLDLGGVMSFVCDHAPRLTNASGAIIELAEGEDMVYRAASGASASALGLRLQRKGSLSGLCIDSGTVLNCADSELDQRVDREACRHVGLRSMLVSPLKHLGINVGVLKVLASETNAFAEDDVHVLELMSELIAAAMFHAAKYETNELYLKATHDVLTGLPNRALFHDRLRQSIEMAKRASTAVGVLNVDMDGLKPINDAHGHRAGDAAIKEAAQRMRASARKTDTVARMGGDEFAIILPNIRGPADADTQSTRLRERVRAPFEFEGRALSLDVSIGAVIFPHDGSNMLELLDRADERMYEMKRAKRAG